MSRDGCRFCGKDNPCDQSWCPYIEEKKMKTIKFYRFTVKHTEYLPKKRGYDVVTYGQTDWSSVTLIPGPNQEIVKIETKEVEVADECLRRKKK